MTVEENKANSIAILDSYRDEISNFVYDRSLDQINMYTEDDFYFDEEAIKKIIKMEIGNENKAPVWTQQQGNMYWIAKDKISNLRGIFSRQKAVIDDEELKKIYYERWSELWDEEAKFDGFDDEIVADVIATYGPLIEEYFEMGSTEKEIAAKGLPEKIWTTKVDYGKYGR